MIRRFGFFLTAAMLVQSAHAFPGRQGAAFLDVPVGAGPAALGGAYTALATDAYATTYNPAGLAHLKGPQLAAQHVNYIDTIHHEHFSWARPGRNKNGFGLTAQYFGSQRLARTDQSGTKTGEYSSYFGMAGISYGRILNRIVSFGFTGKVIRGDLDNQTANAVAGDIGALFQLRENISAGATFQNLGSRLKFVNAEDSLPATLKLGIASRFQSWLWSADGGIRNSELVSAHGGAEWRPVDVLALRLGYRTDTLRENTSVAGLTVGMGFNIWNQEVAYAYLPLEELGNAHYFSVLLNFGSATRS
jgi:hypothetical protein